MIRGDITEQIPLQQSTEWHHSIIDWLSRESSVLVRQSNTNIHSFSQSPPTNRLPIPRHSHTFDDDTVVVDDDIVEQERL